MHSKVVEPSEILKEGEEPTNSSIHDKQNSAVSNPWIRFLARMMDYGLFFLILKGLHFLFHGSVPFGKWDSWVPLKYFLWIPVEAICLWSFGKTPGKGFLCIDLRQGRRLKPDFGVAFKRSFNVWFRGLGMGIPVFNVFCMWVAFSKLKTLRTTSWDLEDHFQVTHRFVPTWRLVIAGILAFGVVGF